MDFLVDYLLSFYEPGPYIIVFLILLACGLGLPIPEDVTLFAAGLLAYYGVCGLTSLVLICFFGVILGDSIIFCLGHHYGRKLTRRWFFHKLLPDERLNFVQQKINERGIKFLFAARFMPGFRAPIFFSAGALRVPYRKFLLYDGGAALLSVPAIIGAVYYFGDELDRVVRIIKKVEHGIFLGIIAVILLVLAKWYITHRKLKQG